MSQEFTNDYLREEIVRFRECMGMKSFWEKPKEEADPALLAGTLADPSLLPIERAKNGLAFVWLHTRDLSPEMDHQFQVALLEYTLRGGLVGSIPSREKVGLTY